MAHPKFEIFNRSILIIKKNWFACKYKNPSW